METFDRVKKFVQNHGNVVALFFRQGEMWFCGCGTFFFIDLFDLFTSLHLYPHSPLPSSLFIPIRLPMTLD
jgi:hypothetical protein